MADDLGSVRRTPRPTPHHRSTGDRQTPETALQESAGTTNEASPVSGDHQDVSSRVSSQGLAIYRSPASDALAIEREDGEFTCVERHPDGGWRGTGLIEVVPDDWVLARYQPGPECDMEAYAALPPCTACEGGGQDTHGTVFEAPLAVHFAAPEVEIAGRRRQLCLWCGHVLIDVPLADGQTAWPPWPKASLVRVEDGTATLQPYTYGDPLPPGCCALPDDDDSELYQPSFPQARCAKHADRTEDEPTPGPGCCTACNGTGKVETGYPCEDCYATGHCHPGDVSCDGVQADDDPHPDEAQETRAAADWSAEETDHG